LPTKKATPLTLCAISIAALAVQVACGGSSGTIHGGQTGYTNSNLKGTYTFFALGSDTQGVAPDQYEVGGVLVADGNGKVTGGEQTYSNAGGGHFNQNVTGSYSIASNGLGTITLNTGDASIGVNGTETLSVVILSPTSGLISQFDTSATSNGVLDLQTSTAMPTGGYAFSVLGAQSNTVLAFGGVFNIDNSPAAGDISGAGSVTDMDTPGNLQLAQSLAGTVSAPDSSGKVTIQLAAGFTTAVISFDGYIVDATRIQLVEHDGYATSGGTAIGQGSATGSFTTPASFSGTFVFGYYGYNLAGYGATAGVITADGASGLNNGLIDQTQGGTVISDTLTGSYANDGAGTGRVVLTTNFGANGTGPTIICYQTGGGQPIPVLHAETTAREAGVAYTQSGSSPSFSGTYGVGYTSVQFAVENDINGVITVSGGTFSGAANENIAFVPASNQKFSGGFSSGSNGRFTGMITANGSSDQYAFYFVDNTRAVLTQISGGRITLGNVRQQAAP